MPRFPAATDVQPRPDDRDDRQPRTRPEANGFFREPVPPRRQLRGRVLRRLRLYAPRYSCSGGCSGSASTAPGQSACCVRVLRQRVPEPRPEPVQPGDCCGGGCCGGSVGYSCCGASAYSCFGGPAVVVHADVQRRAVVPGRDAAVGPAAGVRPVPVVPDLPGTPPPDARPADQHPVRPAGTGPGAQAGVRPAGGTDTALVSNGPTRPGRRWSSACRPTPACSPTTRTLSLTGAERKFVSPPNCRAGRSSSTVPGRVRAGRRDRSA